MLFVFFVFLYNSVNVNRKKVCIILLILNKIEFKYKKIKRVYKY